MNILIFKLVVTPLLIGAVSLAGRRWGSAVGGVLVGLPLTSGPVVLFLALDHGLAFASAATTGILAGTISVGAFCLTYGWLALRFNWRVAVLGSWLVFLACTWALQVLALPLVWTCVWSVAALVLVLWLMPRSRTGAVSTVAAWWDIPARMVLATGIVVLITEVAPVLGPHLSGLLAPFPIFATILAAFTHHFEGPAAAVRVVRGVALGLAAFAAFFVVVAVLLLPGGIAVTFVAASMVAVAMQIVSLWWTTRQRHSVS